MLARLLEEETPFVGLALVISVVDYVVLLADQGKPAVEQLMGSVTRLVMSLAREQDFACRIAEDEFVLRFAQETVLRPNAAFSRFRSACGTSNCGHSDLFR